MKTTKTYSIDEDIYKSFEKLTERLNKNKSSIIENSIIEFLKENGVSNYSTYSLITNPNYEVTIENQDETFTFLSDGSKILNSVFEQSFKKVEKMNLSDPPSILILPPLVIKLYIKDYDKKISFINTINKYKDGEKYSLIGKKFRSIINNKIFKVMEDGKKHVSVVEIIEGIDSEKLKVNDPYLNIKKDLFFTSFKMMEEQVHMGVGDYAFEYLGTSRIDGAPIFKVGGGLFHEFFSDDFDKFKKYIREREYVTIYSINNTGSDKVFLIVDEIEKLPMLEDLIPRFDSEKYNEVEKSKEERKILQKAIEESLGSGIEATMAKDDAGNDTMNNMKSSYEVILDNILFTNQSEDKTNKFIQLMKECLYDIRKGDFINEFETSNQIVKFIKSLGVIETLDPNSEISKVKYQLLREIIKIHNQKY